MLAFLSIYFGQMLAYVTPKDIPSQSITPYFVSMRREQDDSIRRIGGCENCTDKDSSLLEC
jgi:hypothetical protein